jgi:hypothetical protein
MKKAALILIIGSLLAGPGYAGNMTLLTEEEGALDEAPPGLIEIRRTLDEGPEIKVVSPEAGREYESPLRIAVMFIPRGGKTVDLGMLRVECLKIITIDLTKRVMPHATRDGIAIENAELPSGKHKIRVTIGDADGGVTQKVLSVRVF